MSPIFNKKVAEQLLIDFNNNCNYAESWPLIEKSAPDEVGINALIADELASYKRAFESNDTLAILDAFVLSHECGFSIPKWVEGNLSNAFNEYIVSGGDKTLDVILNIKKVGRNNNSFAKRKHQNVDMEIYYNVCILNTQLKFSLPVSCNLLWLCDCGGRSISATRIQDIYDEQNKLIGIDTEVIELLFKTRIDDYLKFLEIDKSWIDELKKVGLYKSYEKSRQNYLSSKV